MKEIDEKLKDKINKEIMERVNSFRANQNKKVTQKIALEIIENVISKYGFCAEDFMKKGKKNGDNMQ